jgi:DNA-directed RNA polymerase subunit RPC12/RpoP
MYQQCRSFERWSQQGNNCQRCNLNLLVKWKVQDNNSRLRIVAEWPMKSRRCSQNQRCSYQSLQISPLWHRSNLRTSKAKKELREKISAI